MVVANDVRYMSEGTYQEVLGTFHSFGKYVAVNSQ